MSVIANANSPLSRAYVAWDNFVTSGSVVATSESSGYPATAAQNFASYDQWLAASSATQNYDVDLGSALGVDCFGVYKHNLGDISGSLLVQYLVTSTYTTLFSVTPGAGDSGNRTLFRVNSNAVVARHWRFVFSGHVAPPQVGVLFLSEATLLPSMEVGFTPPRFGRDTELLNNRAEGGEILGRSVLRQGMKSSIKLSHMNDTVARGVWAEFYDGVVTLPFFFAWDRVAYPDEAYYCYTEKTPKTGKMRAPFHLEQELAFVAL